MSDLSGDISKIRRLNAEISSSIDVTENTQESTNGHFSEESGSDDISISDSTISNFCKLFNRKVGVSTNNLEEVLEIVEILVMNQASQAKHEIDESESSCKCREKVKALRNKNKELQNELLKLQNKNSQ